MVTWTIFYRKIGEIDFNSYRKDEVKKVKKLIKQLQGAGLGTLTYFRWNSEEYERYPAES